ERDLAADDHADLLDGLADTLEAAARHTGPPDLTPGYRQGLLRAALHIRGAAATSRLPSVDEVAGSIPHITPHRAGLASLTPRPTRR
ncbi:MAG: hypothetical protein ACRDYV_02410, partial [Acidimicrobiia bacterium]